MWPFTRRPRAWELVSPAPVLHAAAARRAEMEHRPTSGPGMPTPGVRACGRCSTRYRVYPAGTPAEIDRDLCRRCNGLPVAGEVPTLATPARDVVPLRRRR